MTFGALYGQEQLQGIHIPEAEAQIQREEEEFEASEQEISCFQECLVRMTLLWQHTACCCLYDTAHVSCMSQMHPVVLRLHMYAAVYDMHVIYVCDAIIGVYCYKSNLCSCGQSSGGTFQLSVWSAGLDISH